VTLSTTDPTDVAASLVFVVQSPAAGLIVPNATVSPVAGTDVEVEVDVEVDVEGVVALFLLEQAETKVKVATSTTEATAMDRLGNEVRIRAILCGSLGAN